MTCQEIEKNNSGNSGEHNISPDNEDLTPYLDSLSPVSSVVSPEIIQELSTNFNDSGDSGDSGDKSTYVIEGDDKEDDSDLNKNCNYQEPVDLRIGFNYPFYFCKEHPKVQNIYLESISHHLECSTDHKKESIAEEEQLF